MQDPRQRALVGDASLDPFRHELLDILDVALEVAVTRRATGAHCAERTHAAVLLEPLALMQDDLAGALVGASEQRAGHHRVGAGRDRLGDVPRRRHSAVGDDGDARVARALVDRGDLGHAYTRDDARRADRAWAYTHLHGVRPGVHQRLRRFRRRDVACDHLDVPLRLDALHHLRHSRRMTVRGVDDEHVDARVDQRACALPRVGPDAHRSADPQASLRVLGRVRELDPLLDVLDGDQPAQHTVAVDDRELLDLVPVQDRLCLAEGRADRGCDEVARRHQLGNGL